MTDTQEQRDWQDRQDAENLRSSDPAVVLDTVRRIGSQAVREEYDAQTLRAQKIAEGQGALYAFFKKHRHLAVDANAHLIRNWCHDHNILLSADSIMMAYLEIKHQMVVIPEPPPPTPAELAAKENERLLNSSQAALHREIRKNDRARVADDAPVVIPYTGKQLLQLPARVLRNLMSFENGQDRQSGRVRQEVNRIIREYVTQRDARKA